MLIYNHKQKFIGINEKDLRSLGFRNLEELQNECSDFADLFVKRPTYIHNFKNFNWIYYILNSDIGEAKVIISAKNREFSATLEIETLYLTDEPGQPAYAITLSKIRALDGREIELSKKENAEALVVKPTFKPDEEYLPNLENEKVVVLSEPDAFETPHSNVINDPYDFDFNAPLELEDVYIPHEDKEDKTNIESDFEFGKFDNVTEEFPSIQEEPKEEKLPEIKTKIRPMLGDYTAPSDNEYINNLQVSKNYIYNPQVASDELGLPVDLIEEFIGDFIQQSYDFKDELYNHLATNELGELKLLSHKLKGVAANLRIEDAFEVLSIVNTSSNIDEIKATLDHFYNIIAKLEGKEPQMVLFEEKNPIPTEISTLDDIFLLKDLEEEKKESKDKSPMVMPSITVTDDDIYDINLKFDEDEPVVLQEDLPEKIDQDSYTEAPEEFYEIPEDPKVPTEVIESLDYNKSAAINELGLPINLIEELLGDFKEEAKNLVKQLEVAVETNDNTALYDIVMNIKGTADNLRVTKISKVLEDLLSVNDLQEAKNLLIRLKNYINQL